MSDPSHREFMRDLNMSRDKMWAEMREQVKGKSNEQLTHTERYLIRREAWRRIEKAPGLDWDDDGQSTFRHQLEIMHEVNAMLGGYRPELKQPLNMTKVVQRPKQSCKGLSTTAMTTTTRRRRPPLMNEHSLRGMANMDAHTNTLADIFAAKANIPRIQAQIEASARQVALAIECGVLSPARVAEIRAALAFADAFDNKQHTDAEQEEPPATDNNRP